MQNCDATRFTREFSADVFVKIFSKVAYMADSKPERLSNLAICRFKETL